MDLLRTYHRVIPLKTQQLLLLFCLSVFSGLCQGCGFLASSNPATTISNPQATTDYTILDVLTVNGCDTGGFFLTEWRTAVVDNQTFPAPSVIFPLSVATGTVTGTFVFLNLIPNSLTPGDQVTFVNPQETCS
jgi:hypothetical protein